MVAAGLLALTATTVTAGCRAVSVDPAGGAAAGPGGLGGLSRSQGEQGDAEGAGTAETSDASGTSGTADTAGAAAGGRSAAGRDGGGSPSRTDSAGPEGGSGSGAAHPTAPDRRSGYAPAPGPVPAPGAHGVLVRELQARLAELKLFDHGPTGYYGSVTAAAVASFQGRSGLPRTGGTDSATWRALRDRTRQPTWTQLYPPTSRPVAAPDPRCLTGRVLCISKSSDTLAWMIDGRVISAMDVRFGAQYTPTREGAFRITFKSRHHVSTLYRTAMPYAMFFSGGQAVHYSADFAARGYHGASHGCVNVRDRTKIAALFAEVRTGDRVVVYK
ncbi:L,D-transpeptidase family protein [Streptomyces sp. MST-110588]|uniref:L,D-transpeptidase family protein n=1 Tax=Streptomyces sp. MST-110588 TaxID=2833628 RepID=UPI001F5DFEAB|nr:L,D-transpeptidase family protein [Streptomyces sp. MST-110588]